jgi:hypothetical protein
MQEQQRPAIAALDQVNADVVNHNRRHCIGDAHGATIALPACLKREIEYEVIALT